MSYEEIKSEVNTKKKRKFVPADFDVVLFDGGDVLTTSGDSDGGAPFPSDWGASWEDQ